MSTPDCGECGTRAEPGKSFCDACGAVLRWDAGGRGGPSAASGAASGRAHGSQGTEPYRTPAQGARAEGHGTATATGPAGSGVPAASAAPGGHRPSGPAAPEHSGSRGGGGTADASRSTAGAASGSGAASRSAYGSGSADPGLEDTAPRIPLPTAQDGFPPERPASASSPNGPNGPNSSHHPNGPDSGNSHPADRARSLLVPVPEHEAPPAAPAPSVAPVLPGRPDTDRPKVRVPGPQGTGHGPPCSWCATPNHPDRHFCNRCAMPLAESAAAPAPGRRPWWRRLCGPGGQETPWAGDRPRLRRAFDRVGTWITLAVAVTLVVLGVLYLPDGIQATRDHFAKRAPVEPDEIRASRSYPGHGPKLVIDKLNNTWWGPGVEQSGQGEWVEMRFARPVRLLDVIITPGTSTRADQLGKSALPHRVTATITGRDGRITTRALTLDPGAGGQRRAFRVGEATKVRFTVESAHAASAGKQVAIAEIELFGRSGGDQS
ncbi:zinc ribbon domain-containing protein [Streptomyces sp. NPDC039022]|uniref:NADase-type glycan-binding domain-containing protein n=1 Tax=Streptomyces sp. NPDC039022 TaxID=3157091 RepID=UPI0033D827A7